MSTLDKNITIIPSVGSNLDPQIIFTGANANSNGTIVLFAYPESNGTLSFEGSAGQLFSITNELTGTIFSVNDISGIPSIEVIDTGLIKLAQYSGNVAIGRSNANYELDVSGDINITGDYRVNGVIFNPNAYNLYTATIGDASSNSINVSHNLNNTNIIVSVRETISGIMVYPSITFVNSNTIKFDFVTAPTLNQYSVSMIALSNNESSYTANVGNGSNNILTVTHNLNKTNILTSVKENANGIVVYPDISYLNSNSLTLTFVYVPSANQYSVSIIGL